MVGKAKIILCFVLVLCQTHALQFYLEEGQTICFSENIAPNAKVLGEYTVAAGNGHMPVDIVVRDLPENTTLLERTDINHGKFAFIMPFGKEAPKMHTAELHRTEGHHHHPPEHEHGHDWDSHHDQSHHDDSVHHRQTRSLLSYDEHRDSHDHHDSHGYDSHHDSHSYDTHHNEHDDHAHDHDRDHDHHEHDHDHGHGHEHDYNGHNDGHHEREHDYHEHLHDGVEKLKKLDHMDAHDGEHEDMHDNWDADKYDGIHDEDLEKDWEENEKHAPHHPEDDETDEEDDLFKERRVEICISNRSQNRSLRRRVRLLMRHGKMAHDYTRLAKKENLSSLELTLRIVSDELKWLLSELDHARQMEDALRKLNEGTSRRVVHYASISMLVLIGVSAFQAMYTKRFFKTKKLL